MKSKLGAALAAAGFWPRSRDIRRFGNVVSSGTGACPGCSNYQANQRVGIFARQTVQNALFGITLALCWGFSSNSASAQLASAQLLTFDDVTVPPVGGTTAMPTNYGGVAWSFFGWGGPRRI
jgi:hypothetical protein